MRRSALLAACLLAALATAACSTDGMIPPAELGGAGTTSTSVAAPSPALAPVASAPTTSSPGDTTTLSTSADAAPLSAEATPAFSGTEPSATMPQGDGGPVAAVISTSRVQFAPITGATSEAAAPLSERLAARARERGIGLAGNGALPTHILKGYFSEIPDGEATTVVYVWDVLDPAGNRLHRIQGTAKADGAGGWSAVSAKTMQAIADRTIDELAQWLSMRTG